MSSPTPALPSSFSTTTHFHNTTPATSNSATRQPRLRASCDGCFLAKVKCTKSRPVCSRCLAVGLVCRYSPSSRSLGSSSSSHGKALHDRENGGKGRKSRVRRNGSTAVLASTMSEESCAWLAQQGGVLWGGSLRHDNTPSGYGKGRVDEGFEWDSSSLSMVNLVNPTLGSEWLAPETPGWIQFGYPGYENTVNGDDCWHSMRQVNSPFSIGSSEMDEATVGEPVTNQGPWV